MTRDELTDLIAEALDDSMGPDWNSRLGARYVVNALDDVDVPSLAYAREEVARLVYERFLAYDDRGQYRPWVERGNSDIQNNARVYAGKLLDAAGVRAAKAGEWHSRVENATLYDRIERLSEALQKARYCVEQIAECPRYGGRSIAYMRATDARDYIDAALAKARGEQVSA